MGEDIRYVLRDIADTKLLNSGEFIINYTNGKSDYTRPLMLPDKIKLPMLVICEYKKIGDGYRLVGFTKVMRCNSSGRPIEFSNKFGDKLENKLSFGGPFVLPEKTDKIINERCA